MIAFFAFFYTAIVFNPKETADNLKKYGKKALVNANDPIQVKKTADMDRITFGALGSTYPFHGFTYGSENLVGIRYNETEIKSKLTCSYNINNLGAALALGLYYNIPDENIKDALENYRPANSRSQWFETSKNRILLDAYNANPSSMALAIQNFSEIKAPSKWVILGDMFELGIYAQEEHHKIATAAKEAGFEKVILAGANFSSIQNLNDSQTFSSTQDVETFLKDLQPQNKTILIKGSRGMALEKLLPLL